MSRQLFNLTLSEYIPDREHQETSQEEIDEIVSVVRQEENNVEKQKIKQPDILQGKDLDKLFEKAILYENQIFDPFCSHDEPLPGLQNFIETNPFNYDSPHFRSQKSSNKKWTNYNERSLF